MALIDSLLLEPSPFEIWVAYRTDRQKGTGTIADPFDGSPEHGPQLSIQALGNSGQEASVTNSPHPFSDGDVVTISGATGDSKDRWNGTFVIYDVNGPKTSFNLVWVDFYNGVDALAARGRLTIPFRTLTAVKNAAVSGDTIVVLPGTYNEKNLLKNGVNWHFLNGAKVDYSGASDGGIFDTGGSSIASSITGHGEFINSASGTNSNVVLVTTGTGLNLQIQAKAMSSNKSCVKVNVSGGTVDINVALSIVSVAERTIQNLGSAELVSVRADYIRSSGEPRGPLGGEFEGPPRGRRVYGSSVTLPAEVSRRHSEAQLPASRGLH